METHTAIDNFEELLSFFNDKKEELDGKIIRIKIMANSDIVANEEGYFINPEKIKKVEFASSETELNLYLFRNSNPDEVPVNAKASFSMTKELWGEMRPKFVISYS